MMRTPTIDRMVLPDGRPARDTAPVGAYVYRIKSTGDSSAKFGPCELCGKHVSEVFLQTEGRIFEPNQVTHYKCKDWFGHESCLISQRR